MDLKGGEGEESMHREGRISKTCFSSQQVYMQFLFHLLLANCEGGHLTLPAFRGGYSGTPRTLLSCGLGDSIAAVGRALGDRIIGDFAAKLT